MNESFAPRLIANWNGRGRSSFCITASRRSSGYAIGLCIFVRRPELKSGTAKWTPTNWKR